jgi:hypothetical protein
MFARLPPHDVFVVHAILPIHGNFLPLSIITAKDMQICQASSAWHPRPLLYPALRNLPTV